MPKNGRIIESGGTITLLFNIGSILVINLAFLLLLASGYAPDVHGDALRQMWVLINVSAIPALAFSSTSRHDSRAMVMDRVMRSALTAVAVHALFLLSLTAFLHLNELDSRQYLLYYALVLVGLLAFKVCGSYALKVYRRKGYNFTRVVVVGTGTTAERLTSSLNLDSGYGYKILGFFDDSADRSFSLGKVYDIGELSHFVEENDVQQIFYTLSGHSASLKDVIRIADDHCIQFYYVPQLPRSLARNFELHNVGHIPVLSIRRNPLKSMANRIVKRTFDLVVSSLFLCAYPLIYIPVAIAIKLSSPGPVYFKQERTGYMGQSFKCLKFRTMHVNKSADRDQATKDDPRKTRLGDILRRTSIDELPQFINVWLGDMSIVGPRPHMLAHTEQYAELIDNYMLRHAVKPGITGWAQVNGYRGLTDELWKMERRVECDVWYIENWNLLLDIKIVVRTAINALKPDKNAF